MTRKMQAAQVEQFGQPLVRDGEVISTSWAARGDLSDHCRRFAVLGVQGRRPQYALANGRAGSLPLENFF